MTALAAFLAARSPSMLTVAPGITTPRYFTDAPQEHLATRHAAGLFDFSFMGCIEVTGADTYAFLQALQTRAVNRLVRGRIAYTLLLRDDGSVLIDATLWQLDRDRYWLFIGRRSDLTHVANAASSFNVTLTDQSPQLAVMAVQGPASRAIIEMAFGSTPIPALPYFGFAQLEFAGNQCWLARIGYSGETGYELVIADAAAPVLWDALLAAGKDQGLLAGGFDAIDSLRIEAGHILFTRELARPVTPAEIGLMRLVESYRPDFRGAAALRAQRRNPPSRHLVGLLPESAVRADAAVPAAITAGTAAVTSTCWSPLLERNLALGFVPAGDAHPGTTVRLANGARAQVARLPFYDPARLLPRCPR